MIESGIGICVCETASWRSRVACFVCLNFHCLPPPLVSVTVSIIVLFRPTVAHVQEQKRQLDEQRKEEQLRGLQLNEYD